VSNAHVWRSALTRLQREVTGAQLNTWLRGAQLVSVVNGAATLHVRSTYERELIESRYHDLIERALCDVIGSPIWLTIATAPGGALGESGSSARAATKLSAAAQATYARPLFLLEDDVDDEGAAEPSHAAVSESLAVSEVTRDATPAGHERVAIERPARQRIPESPTVNDGDGGAREAREIERARAQEAWQPGRSGANTGDRHLSPAVNASPPRSGAPNSVGWHATTPSTREPAARNGEMTSMNDEMHPRFDDDRDSNLSGRDGKRSFPYGMQPNAGGPPADAHMGVAPLTPPRLNQRYTFSTFIVGSGNQLAHAASQAVADAPGYAYNPLFLYGGVGLGKTHLLHAIGHTALERGLTVLYVSSETFTNEIVNAILYRNTEEFRAKYRSVDLLLVDDIQFIAGKDSTEEEFFHTFNSLYESNHQIVICSDRPPKAIVSLEERLRSRFEWGLIADIQPPDLETRIAILRAKAELMGHDTPDEVILYVANKVQSNIRELEGSLNRVLAFAELQGLPMSIETAKAAMASLATDTRQRRVSIEDVVNTVAEYYRIQVDDLKGKQRDKHIVVPRQVAMYLMRQETEASLMEIGQALGGRDHSTVLHGCEKITREVNENTSLRKEVLAIRQQLLG
jgi:chromosomal replication initiator protein